MKILTVWKKAVFFHFWLLGEHFLLIPCIFVPLLGDTLQSTMIQSYQAEKQFSIASDLKVATGYVFPLLKIKAYFIISDILFALIFIMSISAIALIVSFLQFLGVILVPLVIGFCVLAFILYWYQSEKYRVAWAMASNVLVFEHLQGKEAEQRCRELASQTTSTGITALSTIPTLLILAWFALTGFIVYYSHVPPLYWILGVFLYWIVVPGSGAANTFYYLHLVKNEGNQASAKHD